MFDQWNETRDKFKIHMLGMTLINVRSSATTIEMRKLFSVRNGRNMIARNCATGADPRYVIENAVLTGNDLTNDEIYSAVTDGAIQLPWIRGRRARFQEVVQ